MTTIRSGSTSRIDSGSGPQCLGDGQRARSIRTDSSNTIEAIKLGAFNHLTKPVGRSDLKRVLTEALRKPQVTNPGDAPKAAGELVGFSVGMREVQMKIGIAARASLSIKLNAGCIQIFEGSASSYG